MRVGAELAQLRRWKAEAIDVIAQWETAWEAAGRPGRLGESKAAATAREIKRLRFEVGAWRNGVADVVEPLGYDREAACGPADLLPGLLTLAERFQFVDDRCAVVLDVEDIRHLVTMASADGGWNEYELEALERLQAMLASYDREVPASDEVTP